MTKPTVGEATTGSPPQPKCLKSSERTERLSAGGTEAGESRVGDDAEVKALATPGVAETEVDPRQCEIALALLSKKWLIPILVELERAPRRRQYLFATLRISSSRLDPTIQTMTRWGVIERAWIPSGQTDGPGLAITDIGRALLAELTRLSAWQHEHHSELLANSKHWTATHDLGQG